MQLPKSLTTVTPFSKILALSLFILLPFTGFYLGMKYQESITPKFDIESFLKLQKSKQENIRYIPPDSTSTNPVISNDKNQSNSIGYDNLKLLTLTGGESVKPANTILIRWKQTDLTKWGNEIVICLLGADLNNKIIPAKNNWNDQICTYREGDSKGSYLIAKTKLNDEVYSWNVPIDVLNRFEKVPNEFKIRLLVFDNLPETGRTSWEGNVGWSESGSYFLIK